MTTPYTARSEGTFADVYNADHEPTHEFCPECTIAQGMSRQQAYDAFFLTGRLADVRAAKSRLVVRRIVRNFTANRADPTSVDELSCGHCVGF